MQTQRLLYQWMHDDVKSDAEHFEKGSLLNVVVQVMLCIPTHKHSHHLMTLTKHLLILSVWHLAIVMNYCQQSDTVDFSLNT